MISIDNQNPEFVILFVVENLKQAVERERAETKSNLKSATLASWETHPPI